MQLRTHTRTHLPIKSRVRPAVTYIALALIGSAFLLPLLELLSTSLKSQAQNALIPPMWIPSPLHPENYPAGVTTVPFFLFLQNTAIITALEVVGVVLSSALVAYGFSMIQWRGRDAVFLLVVSTMLLPYEVTMIPQYIIFSDLNWVNTFLPLTVPYFFGIPFYIFLLRQFFLRLPLELAEAARIDGASELRIFWQIAMPLIVPALVVVALLQFVAGWNDYLGPLIYLNDQSLYTLTLGMQYFHLSVYQVNVGAEAAYAMIIALPVIIIFFLAQRRFIEGITLTGLKG